jgi:hypothetical protein
MNLNPDADFPTTSDLAPWLIDKIKNYIEEQKEYDENDSTWDYIGGLISAYQSVAYAIGVQSELYELLEEE